MEYPVISNTKVKHNYYKISLDISDSGTIPRPGQFYSILCGQGTDPLLRRPFSVHQVQEEKGRTRLDILYLVLGKGTTWLSTRVQGDRVDATEVNISCPNLDRGGMHFGVDPRITRELVRGIRQATSKTLIIKLTPMVTGIRQLADICQENGADAISLINSPLGMAIDIKTRGSKLGRNITGGIAGPAIKPLALYLVWQVSRTVDIPVIGIGGISSPEDALEFIIAGASAVQSGTWNFVNPGITLEVIKGIETYMQEQGISKLSDLVGSLRIS
ncbi:MAG: hypothetical protein JRJ03_01165 [Deltaproteobacteria bacterium]|nr:hypothetical protein [Deltaproteobacteria bacterium]